MIEVRPADLADIPAILEMGAKLHAESPRYGWVPFDAEATCEMLQRMIQPEGGVIVADDGGAVVGYLLGFSAPYLFSRLEWVGELSFYIAKGHRSFGLARAMVQALEAWAADRGAVEVVLGISPGIDDERVGRLYSLLGFDRCGVEMRKALSPSRGIPPESPHG